MAAAFPSVSVEDREGIMKIIALHLNHKPRYRVASSSLMIQMESPSNPFHALPMSKRYQLTAPDGSSYESDLPGELGGNSRDKIYGRLDCSSAIRALPMGYARHRVFFKDEAAAIAAGYRPCGNCLKPRYQNWKAGGETGTESYPWLRLPGKGSS